MPHLSALVESGCMGQISTIRPVYSPMVWTSIATGKRPYKHGVLGFSEPVPDGTNVRPVSGLSRKSKAFWNIFHQQGWRGNVIGWWPSHPAEPINGVMISNFCHRAIGPEDQPWPVPPGGMHPPNLVDTLAELRFNPNEFHHTMLEPFIPRASEIDQKNDPRLAKCMMTLAEAVTIQSWATWLIENSEWDYMAVYFDAMDHFAHGFMSYHPPKRDHVSDRDFELYSRVMSQAARFHDMMLGSLLAKAGADTTVILLSDHGFHPDDLLPAAIAPIPAGPADEHRDFGILVISGPGIRKDELLHGASVLDITPTLLALEDLPVGEDMDGRPLLAAWEQPPAVRFIASWDAMIGDDGRHPADLKLDPESERAALEQLIALGYVQRPPDNIKQAVAEAERELRINLAEALIDGGKEIEALPILRELTVEWPDGYRFFLRLAMCCKSLGRVVELRRVVEALDSKKAAAESARAELAELRRQVVERAKAKKELERGDGAESALRDGEAASPESPITPEEAEKMNKLFQVGSLNMRGLDFLRGVLAIAEKKPVEALAHLKEAEKGMRKDPGLYLQIGQAWQLLGKWDEGLAAFERALQLDPHNPHGFVGQARCLLALRRWDEAAGAALNAINLLHFYPFAHFLLGIAMLRLGHSDRATLAFEATVALNPAFWPAHLRLARLLKVQDPDSAAWHLENARAFREQALAVARGETTLAERPSVQIPAHKSQSGSGTFDSVDFAPQLLTPNKPGFEGETITLVTGLPRSGTSLLMQMLAAGGIEPLTDSARVADPDNPNGYFEMEAVKSIARDSSFLSAAVGKAVKVVLPLLPHLSSSYLYKILLIERNLEEVFASQRKMLERSGQTAADPATLRPAYERLLRRSRQLLAATERVQMLRLSHRWVLENPSLAADQIADFVGGALNRPAMAAAIDTSLYRSGQGAK